MKTNIIRLDVGGTIFTTSMTTLTSTPTNRLARLVLERLISTSSNTLNNSPVQERPIVIDRDGTHFRYVLNYLRDGDHVALPSNLDVLAELLVEVDFYELFTLKRLINEKQKALQKNLMGVDNRTCHCTKSPTKKETKINPERPVKLVPTVVPLFERGDIPSIDEEEPMFQTHLRPIDNSPDSVVSLKDGQLVHWSAEGFNTFWLAISTSVAAKGYVDYLFCVKCDNDYEVRLPELTEPIFGWEQIRKFLEPMCGRVNGICNDSCAYVAWRHIYCAKDGYLDSVQFNLHVPMTALIPFEP